MKRTSLCGLMLLLPLLAGCQAAQAPPAVDRAAGIPAAENGIWLKVERSATGRPAALAPAAVR